MADLRDQLTAALAGRYAIERELGRGGMATVFLAEDLRHHRKVAVKVLAPEVAAAVGPERFLREIETVASLAHPHILPLFDSGAVGGLLFYVMPYVEGESLRDRLTREKQLPLDDALRIVREVAAALNHAHQRGVVHRDVKPENILLESGVAVVADFGVARAIAAGGARLTTSGVAIGTPACMSPEQAAGGTVDARADVYGLGCTLYEMLAGQAPFTGPTAESVIFQHLNAPPPHVSTMRPTVPPGVDRALVKALAKAPADRYATTAEFAAALDADSAAKPEQQPGRSAGHPVRWAGTLALGVVLALLAVAVWQSWWPFGGRGAPPAKKDWILVAEFEGPPGDSTLAPAAQSLLSAALDQSQIVATVPREHIREALTASGRAAGARVDAELAREIAYRSAVRAVLEGKIARLGRGYTVVLRVVDADTARVLLTESATAKDETALMPALEQMAKRLRAGLGEQRATLVATRPMALVATPSLEAYRLYAQADRYATGHRHHDALTLYRRALEVDPDFAMAWLGLADCFTDWGQWDSVRVVCDEALRRPRRLTSRQRREAEAMRAAAGGDDSIAVAAYDQILAEDPLDLNALTGSADALWHLGRYEDSLDRLHRAMSHSPFGPSETMRTLELYALWPLGRFDEAQAQTRAMPFSGRFLRAETELVAENYAAAESMAVILTRDRAVMDEAPFGVYWFVAVAEAARGSVGAAAASYERAAAATHGRAIPVWERGLRLEHLQLSELCRCTAPAPAEDGARDTAIAGFLARGLGAAIEGDAKTARRLLEAARVRLKSKHRFGGDASTLLAARIEALDGRWVAAADLLAPIANQPTVPHSRELDVEASWIRWYLADAWEKVGRPDSAIAQLERIVSEPASGPTPIRPYARQRLVLLYAHRGRVTAAAALLAALEKQWDRPDATVRRMLDEARSAVHAARDMAARERS